jgi:FkbM family methyltransferase
MKLPNALRALGARLIRAVPVRIRAGPNRGLRWTLASSGRGYLSGRYESERLHALLLLVRPGDHVWDIGAHKGYVAMALARKVGSAGSVTAFEPSAANLWFLRKHLAWNGVVNVRVVPVAVSDRNGQDRFGGRGSSVSYRLGGGAEQVRVATLRSLVEEEGLSTPNVLKIDVEGSEAAALRGAGDLLSQEMLLFVSIHSRSAYDACRQLLAGRGYRLYESHAMAKRSADPSLEWGADHELMAVGQQMSISEQLIRDLPLFAT